MTTRQSTARWPLSGLLGSAASLLLVAAAPPAPGRGVRPPPESEMEVVGVVRLSEAQGSLLLLGEKGGERLVPMVIGPAEGSSIEMALRHASPPRPLAHDLLQRAIAELGAKVLRVDVDAYRGGVFFAKLRLDQRGRKVALDARPSDSVALALRVQAPIYASREVLEAAGVSRRDIQPGPGGEPALPGRPPPAAGVQEL